MKKFMRIWGETKIEDAYFWEIPLYISFCLFLAVGCFFGFHASDELKKPRCMYCNKEMEK